MRNDDFSSLAIERQVSLRYNRLMSPTRRDVTALLFRQRWWILAVFALVVCAVALSGAWKPQYSAEMKLLVMRQRADTLLTASADPQVQYNDSQVSAEDINSEVELLNSEDLLRDVVLATGLDAARGSSSGDPNARIARAVRKLGSDLDIRGIAKTNVILVRYRGANPQIAKRVLDTLAAGYMKKHTQMHQQSGATRFFEQQTAQYSQALDEAQEKLAAFSKETGIVSADLERDAALRRADEFDATARQAETNELEIKQREATLHAELSTINPRVAAAERKADNPQLLDQLKATLLNLELKRTELLTKYEPTYRLVQEVDQQIAKTNKTIEAEESRPIRDDTFAPNPDYQWAEAELTKAETDLSGLKARAAAATAVAESYRAQAEKLNRNMLTQQNLIQAAKTQEQDYLLYKSKREAARINDALDRGGFLNVVVAEQPSLPALPERSSLLAAAITFLLAGTISLSTAFVRDYIDPTFRTPNELSAELGMPVLGALPKSVG